MSVRTQKSFTSGPVFMPMLCFVLPIMLTNILQTLYNIADNVIVGRFSGDPLALAAVGSTGSLSTLFLNLAVGLSAGTSVVISHAFGARNHQRVSDGVHTALVFGLLFGVGLGTVAFVFAEDMLVLIGTKPELLSSATLYLCIIFATFPLALTVHRTVIHYRLPFKSASNFKTKNRPQGSVSHFGKRLRKRYFSGIALRFRTPTRENL